MSFNETELPNQGYWFYKILMPLCVQKVVQHLVVKLPSRQYLPDHSITIHHMPSLLSRNNYLLPCQISLSCNPARDWLRKFDPDDILSVISLHGRKIFFLQQLQQRQDNHRHSWNTYRRLYCHIFVNSLHRNRILKNIHFHLGYREVEW